MPVKFGWLFTKPDKVGSGKYLRRVLATGLKHAEGILLPMNGVPGKLPPAVQFPVAGLKIVRPSPLKSPAFSATVGREINPELPWFCRYHSMLRWKNVRFFPL